MELSAFSRGKEGVINIDGLLLLRLFFLRGIKSGCVRENKIYEDNTGF